MTIDDIIAEINARLGETTSAFRDRTVGDATVDGWVWVKDQMPCGMRIERIWDRHVVRAWRHTVPHDRRAELLRHGPLTVAEIRTVAVLAGLLPDPAELHILQTDPWGWTIQHPATCLPDLFACRVHVVAATELVGQRTKFAGVIHRYEVALNDFGDRLQVLDRVDSAHNDPSRSAGCAWPDSDAWTNVAAGGGQL